MSRLMHVTLFSGLALGLCLVVSPMTRADDEEEKEAKENKAAAEKVADPLKKLIAAIDNGKAVDKAVVAVDKQSDNKLKPVMWAAYKPRQQGGLGVGDKPGTTKPDGIEAKLIAMAKKPLPAEQLQKESEALIKMAEVAKAMGEMADLYTPKNNAPKKPIAAWQKFNKMQKDGAQDLIDAIKTNDPNKVMNATGTCIRAAPTATAHSATDWPDEPPSLSRRDARRG